MATSKAVSVISINNLLGVLDRRSESHGITLEWEPYSAIPRTDGSTIYLPLPKPPMTEEDMIKLYGYVIHECGHNARPEAFELAKPIKNKNLFMIYNLVEDDGMEREVASKYIGDAKALGKKNALVVKSLSKAWTEASETWKSDLTQEGLAPMIGAGIGQLSRLEWDVYSSTVVEEFIDSMHPIAKNVVVELIEEGWVKRFQGTKTPKDTLRVAKDFYKRLYPNAKEDEQEESSKDTPPPSQGEGQGEEAEGEGKASPQQDEGSVVSWRDACMSDHSNSKKREPGQLPGTVGIDWEGISTEDSNVGLMPPKLINVVHLYKEDDVLARYKLAKNSYKKYLFKNTDSKAFAARVRRYIQAKARTKVTVDKYHGKINKGAMIKLALPPIDGGDWNKKLFYELSEAKALDTCILVLTDWSGSMVGRKMVYAADASMRLVHVFDKILRVPILLAAFSNGRTSCDIGIIKPFNKHTISGIDMAKSFAAFYHFTGGNNDSDALLWAHRELLKRKEQRKMLIVLSDGCPAGSYAGSAHWNLKRVAKDIEKWGRVELYGVGIRSHAVSNYYSNYKIIEEPNEINKVLFDLIKEGITK